MNESKSPSIDYIMKLKKDFIMSDWLASLKTETPQKGFELAITLVRKGVAYTQPSYDIILKDNYTRGFRTPSIKN